MSELGDLVIADDEQDIIDLLSYELQYEGFKVRHANDGRQALDLVKQKAPDLLLTDVRMPEMNGYQLAKAVREELKLQLPIVVITGYSEYENELKNLGIIEVVRKPVEVSNLIDLIKKTLR